MPHGPSRFRSSIVHSATRLEFWERRLQDLVTELAINILFGRVPYGDSRFSESIANFVTSEGLRSKQRGLPDATPREILNPAFPKAYSFCFNSSSTNLSTSGGNCAFTSGNSAASTCAIAM